MIELTLKVDFNSVFKRKIYKKKKRRSTKTPLTLNTIIASATLVFNFIIAIINLFVKFIKWYYNFYEKL